MMTSNPKETERGLTQWALVLILLTLISDPKKRTILFDVFKYISKNPPKTIRYQPNGTWCPLGQRLSITPTKGTNLL